MFLSHVSVFNEVNRSFVDKLQDLEYIISDGFVAIQQGEPDTALKLGREYEEQVRMIRQLYDEIDETDKLRFRYE